MGVIFARNNGINFARGRYIYTLDSDDVIEKTTLEKCYNAICWGKGDIITTRVMMFGLRDGEYVLPKPNKKIYRVPEILFYYRLKNHEESRNYQKREKHEYLLKALENKYPKLAKEKQKRDAKTFSDKVVHFIRKIRRFFYKKKKGDLYVCRLRFKIGKSK
ncbi:MAG: glycosyltransferase [Alphaproteobacteria bacterium]|nr:glycosyltransferase [Alphaproteobacteria bacterium]